MEETMNKIIIDPHNCSREELDELKRYLSADEWDWKEEKPNQGFTIIEGLVTLVAISICVGFIALIVFGIKGCNHVMDKGVKNVATDIWEGSDTTTTNQ